MLKNMFIGRPPGNYDRLLDFSRPATGSLYFVPPASFLDNVTSDAPNTAESAGAPSDELPSSAPAAGPAAGPAAKPVAVHDTSLRIGSLKGEKDE
jgi:porphyrinogen peroxidase